MSIYEAFPEVEGPRDMSQEEMTHFAETNIWPAAIFFWGNSYKDPAALDDNEPIELTIESPDGDNKLVIGLSVYYEQALDDDEGPKEIEASDMFVSVSIETLRPDMNHIFKSSLGGLQIWEVSTYDFYLDGSEPEADRFYVVKSEDNEEFEPNRLSPRLRGMLKKISKTQRFNPERDADLNSQDIIDIHNILLALEIPEGIISLV